MKVKYTLLTILTTAALLSCGGESDSQKPGVAEPLSVTTAELNDKATGKGLVVNGLVQASSHARLSTRMMGFVERIPVKVGDKVRKGQLLIDISNSDLSAKRAQAEAGIAAARANFENAERDLERFTNLYNNNSASQKELDDITTRYNMAKAQFETANGVKKEVDAQFAYVNIRSPFNGIVTNIFTDEGDMANPGMPLIAVEAPGGFEVEAAIPESEINNLDNTAKVNVYIKSLNTYLDGALVEISPSGANTGGQYMATVKLDEPFDGLRAGMYAQLEFKTSRPSGSTSTLLVPKQAIVQQGQLTGIYTVSAQNTAILRWVRLGRDFGDEVEVLSGMDAGEVYILSAGSKLYNGAPIEVQ